MGGSARGWRGAQACRPQNALSGTGTALSTMLPRSRWPGREVSSDVSPTVAGPSRRPGYRSWSRTVTTEPRRDHQSSPHHLPDIHKAIVGSLCFWPAHEPPPPPPPTEQCVPHMLHLLVVLHDLISTEIMGPPWEAMDRSVSKCQSAEIGVGDRWKWGQKEGGRERRERVGGEVWLGDVSESGVAHGDQST